MLSSVREIPLLVIGNKNYSSWSLRPWLLMRGFDVAFDELRFDVNSLSFREKVGAWSPTLQVPVLHHDGLVVHDSLAISEYVNERWLEGRGWPAEIRKRARARAVAAEMHSGFQTLRRELPMNCRRQPRPRHLTQEVKADIDRIQDIWQNLRADSLEDGEFLFGKFGIADAMYAPVAMRFVAYGVSLDRTSERYLNALMDLPSMQEWIAASKYESETIEWIDSL